VIVREERDGHLAAAVWSETPTLQMDTWALNPFGVVHHREQPVKDPTYRELPR
jgi:hypothetical protein